MKASWLFVVPWSLDSIGGVSEVVRSLIIQCENSGRFKPQLLVAEWFESSVPGATQGAVKEAAAIRFREPGKSASKIRDHLAFAVHFLPTLIRLHRYLKENQITVVNIHYPGLSAFYFAVARQLKWIDSMLLSFHGADLSTAASETFIRAALNRWTARRADAIVGCSDALADRIASVMKLSRGTITAIHNGLDVEQCKREIDSSELIEETREFILCVAAFEHKKGIDILLRAFAQVASEHPHCNLIVIGRYTSHLPVLEQQLSDLGKQLPQVAARIEFIVGESHGKILRRMREARMLVLPSRIEPFGLVILEAGFSGVPVIASRVGGIPEIIEHNVHGLLVASEDVDELARAIEELMHDSAEAARLADALQCRVAEQFTWSTAWAHYLGLTRPVPSS